MTIGQARLHEIARNQIGIARRGIELIDAGHMKIIDRSGGKERDETSAHRKMLVGVVEEMTAILEGTSEAPLRSEEG